jgi:Asp-tRNA(Asn)/Glu-tRNA(Gln) amidotransferase A subunit family amidase
MPRIGLCRTSRWGEADTVAQLELKRIADLLRQAGSEVSEFVLQDNETLLDIHDCMMSYEAAHGLAWEHLHHSELLSASLRSRLENGWTQTRETYDAARAHGHTCRRRFVDSMHNFDFLLTFAAPGEAPSGHDTTGSSLFNRAWMALGVPCVTIPAGTGPRGLPLGVQLVGHFDRDSELMSWAHWVEQRIA